MGALLAGGDYFDPSAFARAAAELEAQRLGIGRAFECGALRVIWYPGYAIAPEGESCLQFESGFVACVGTLFHGGKVGPAALRSAWQGFEDGGWRDEEPWGNWVLALAKRERLWLVHDRLGMIKVYERPEARIFSTSWLACLASDPSPRVDRLGTLDYVLAGANHGKRTPVAGVRVVDPTLVLDLTTDQRRSRSTPSEWFSQPRPESIDEAVREAANLVVDRAATIRSAFGDRIHCALSGGFDSRLILAALRSAGTHPSIHVYGSAADEDVRIARLVTEALDVPLVHVDKGAADAALPPLTIEALDERMRFFDGIPPDDVFDRGPDRDTRLRQSEFGSIALNGGGGEILRNFFYLGDRALEVAQIVQAFYGNHDPRVARRPTDLRQYLDEMAESIAAQVGHGERLCRQEVEAVYPLFRCRFWTSRNNSLAARCGHFLTPLLDPALVRLALSLPLRWKDYGRFEARLIAALDPVLGRLPLSYGFAPADGPSRGYVAKMWLQHRRPPWLRSRTLWAKRVLGRAPTPTASPDARALVTATPRVADVLDLARLGDAGQLARALTLEHAFAAYEVL